MKSHHDDGPPGGPGEAPRERAAPRGARAHRPYVAPPPLGPDERPAPRSVRGHRTARCERCRMAAGLCVCALLAPVEATTRVVVLMPERESRRSSNTARFVGLTLPGTTILVRGRRDPPFPREAFVEPARRSVVLYPRAGAATLDAAWVAHDPRPVTLVVPDGCWREGRRLDGREAALEGLERVTIAPGPASRYRLRNQTDARRLSTLEAIARALEVLEGARGPAVRAALEATLDLFVERTLRHRGALDLLDERVPEYGPS